MAGGGTGGWVVADVLAAVVAGGASLVDARPEQAAPSTSRRAISRRALIGDNARAGAL